MSDSHRKHLRAMRQFLIERGWRLYLRTHWFKPLPGHGDRLAIIGQRIYGLREAFDTEMRAGLPKPPPGYAPPPRPPKGAA